MRGFFQHWRMPAICLVLAAITFAVFGQTLTHQFVDYDDDLYVYDNPMVKHGLTRAGTVWAFTHFHSVNWHPLTWLSHMLDCQLYGLRPGGHHLTNVLLHTLNVLALFLVLQQMTGALGRSALVAAVFAIHPLRVESVAWVAERKDVLSGLFFVLTIGAYAHYARRPGSWRRYGLVLFLFGLGLMCKPMLVTVPLVLLLLDFWPLHRMEMIKPWTLVREKIPLFIMALLGGFITLAAQTSAIHSGGAFSFPARMGNAVISCYVYCRQMIWPTGLAVLYPFPEEGVSALKVAGAGAFVMGVTVIAWGGRRVRPWLLVGWAWYLIMLLPVLGLVQVGRQAHADRYTYLPQIGLYVALAWWMAHGRWRPVLAGTLMTVIVAAFMFCAARQTAYWKNSETLWTRSLACAPDNDIAEDKLGSPFFEEGRIDEAIPHFVAAENMRPGSPEPHYNLGLALASKGDFDGAIAQYRETLGIRPSSAKAHYNFGNALGSQNKLAGATEEYRRALQIQPAYAEAENNLGTVLHKMGKLDEAIAHYERAAELEPATVSVHFNLARAYLEKGDAADAIAHYQNVLALDPSDVETLNNLAWLLTTARPAKWRDSRQAIALARRANDLTGAKSAVVLGTLAAAEAGAGQFENARSAVGAAIILAETENRPELARQLRGELKRYQADRGPSD